MVLTAATVMLLSVCGHGQAGLTIRAIRVMPANPAPGALCQLAVTLANGGDQTASRFRFAVTINGRAVGAYARGRYLHTIEPGQSADLRLYNFWNVDPRDRVRVPPYRADVSTKIIATRTPPPKHRRDDSTCQALLTRTVRQRESRAPEVPASPGGSARVNTSIA